MYLICTVRTQSSVLISEVSLFQGENNMYLICSSSKIQNFMSHDSSSINSDGKTLTLLKFLFFIYQMCRYTTS